MEKWTQEQYAARLQEMKQEAHDKMWLYIEVNAKEFMNECEPGRKKFSYMLQSYVRCNVRRRRLYCRA